MDDTRLAPSNALRPVDWRFQLADHLVNSGRFVSPRKYDHVTCALAMYLQASRRTEPRDLSGIPSGIHIRTAHEIVAGEQAHLRAAIEAAVLAGQDREWIAAKVGVPVKDIHWFEAGFFDVRDRLDASLFILQHVIALARERSNADWKQYGWKLIGYLIGADALERVLGIKQIATLESFVETLDLEIRTVLQEKLSRAMQVQEIDNPATAARLLQAMHAGAKASSKDKPLTDIEVNIQALMEGLRPRFAVGSENSKEFAEVKKWDQGGVELNSDELSFVSMGGKLPWEALLKDAKFPDPPPQD